MVQVRKPKTEDFERIKEILLQWTEKDEVEKYLKRIQNEIEGNIEFNINFWVLDKDNVCIGVGALSDILPELNLFTQTDKSIELKILYLDNLIRGQGLGKLLLTFLENKAKKNHFKEIILRSAERYKDTAYGFYEKMGYAKVGLTDNNMTVFSKKL